MLALVRLLAACAHPAPPAAPAPGPDPFAGCHASSTPPLLTIQCPDTGIFVASLAANGTETEVLDGGMTIVQVSEAVVAELPRPSAPPLKVFRSATSMIGPLEATVVSRRPGTAEFLACAPTGGACDARLVALVGGGLPDLRPLLADWKDPTPVPGRTLAVPRGCLPVEDAPMSGFVCGMDSLVAGVVSGTDTPEQNLDATTQARAKAAAENGTPLAQTRVDCHVDGVAGVCALTTRPPHTPFDPPNDVVGYAVRTDGTQIVADCRWGGEATASPEFCGQLVTWVAPAP